MVFNWFRRQFGTNEEAASANSEVEQEAALEQSDIEAEVAAQANPTEEASTEVAQDYLSFAKAAYKNIQKRQLESETPNTDDADPIELSAPAVEVEPELAQTPEIVAQITEPTDQLVESSTEIELDEPLAEETVSEEVAEPEPEIASEPANIETEIASETTEETTPEATEAPIPIWASNADRQARLERLKETALETPEPVIAPQQPAAVTEEDVADIAFDEGFMWSAEVLASQGRSAQDVSIEEISWLKRLRQGLDKTRRSLINQLKAIVGQGPLNQDAVSEIEALLLQADVGVEATDYIITTLQAKLREEVLPPEQAIAYLKQILRDLLDRPCQESYSPSFVPEKDVLNIWLMTGVNGAGKTTTIGKLAHLASKSGYRCLIGAADTFRAAAVEQVTVWGARSGTEVIANPGKNTDPAAVVFDAIAAAQSRNIELLLVDTAGRLQNKKNLMEELAKIRRIVDKKAPDAKVEALLVLDATLGQNGLRQAEVFSKAAKLSGVVLTKLDGTAKGGVALAVVKELGLPIRFIGAGEGVEDLRPFSSYEFVEALLSG
jgi:fused signal recognition particle receptor